MDSPWRSEIYSPSIACETATYEILEPELLQKETEDLAQFTRDISASPFDPESWLNRAHSLRTLGFPELALADAYKARLLVEAGLTGTTAQAWEGTTALGISALKAFSTKVYDLHMSNPAWAQHVATPDLLHGRVTAMLSNLEIQCYTELMEGLIAANCCNDYLVLSKEAVAKFPADAVFQSELENAEAWYAQRVEQLQARFDEGELGKEEMESTLLNGGVYPTPYPWMTGEILERDEEVLKSIQGEFALASTNCTAARSKIRNTDGEEIADVLGVVATRDIKEGDVVVLETTLQGVIGNTACCKTCCGPITEPVTNSCCRVAYCSQTCTEAALKTFHPVLCGKDFSHLEDAAASATATTDFSLDSLLLLKTLALSIASPTHPLQNTYMNRLTPSYGGPSARLLIFNFPEHIIAPIKMLSSLGLSPFTTPEYDTWVLHTIRCRLQNNKHGQTLDGSHGTAVSSLYSMFNHSCEPNVDWRHDDGSSTVTMFAVADVKEGEEMFISYIGKKGKEVGRKERQRTLMPWFGMDCRCVRCEGETENESRGENDRDVDVAPGLETLKKG